MNKYLFVQLVTLALLDLQKQGFGVFVSFQGHVDALDIRIYRHPKAWREEPLYKIDWFLQHCPDLQKTFMTFVSDMSRIKAGESHELH